MTGICLPNESLYTDQRVQNYILDNFEGISFAGKQQGYEFYSLNKDKLKRSLSLNGSVMDKNLRVYLDEPISNPNNDNKDLDAIIKKFPSAIIGELEKDIMLDLKKKYPSASLIYTAYREWWFKIFGQRIYKWWKDQSGAWSWMFANVKTEILWVHLTLNSNIKELSEIAKRYNKEVWLYIPDNITAEEFLKKVKGIK